MVRMLSEEELERMRDYLAKGVPDVRNLTLDERDDLSYLLFKYLVGEALGELGFRDVERSAVPGDRDLPEARHN